MVRTSRHRIEYKYENLLLLFIFLISTRQECYFSEFCDRDWWRTAISSINVNMSRRDFILGSKIKVLVSLRYTKNFQTFSGGLGSD
jgi:hypothetical protein